MSRVPTKYYECERCEDSLANLPPPLLNAISNQDGGLVSVVIGAGCSVESPTEVPLARPLSSEAYRRLVIDGVLNEGDCDDPSDLSALATVVYEKTGSQAALVERIPMDLFRVAKPNSGHLLLVALMLEGAISHVLSLNFDLAVQNAAAQLGVQIRVIDAVGTPIPNTSTIVQLHGSAAGSSESLILRKETLDLEWRASWKQVVAHQILAAPNVLFVGLGSAAPVLSETVALIAAAIGNNKTFYQAGRDAHDQNYFAQQLQIPLARYMKSTWCELMDDLAKRVTEEQVHLLLNNGNAILTGNGASPAELASFAAIAGLLTQVSLLGLGKLRAYARLRTREQYTVRSDDDDNWMVAPLMALKSLCDQMGWVAVPATNGLWQMKKENRIQATALFVTGQGSRRATAMESSILALCRNIHEIAGTAPTLVIVSGIVPGPLFATSTPPMDIIVDDEQENIISGPGRPLVVLAEEPESLARMEAYLNVA